MSDLNDINKPVITTPYADAIDTLRENIKRVKAGALPIGGGTVTGDLIVNGNGNFTGVVTAGGINSASPVVIKAAAAGDAVLRFVDETNALQGALTWKRATDTLDLSGTLPVTVNGSAPWTAANFNPALYIPLSQKGAPGGVATLDANGVIPAAQDSPDDAIAMAIALG